MEQIEIKQNLTPETKSTIETLSKKQLENEVRYSYCPYCYAEKKKGLQSFEVKDVLPKLWVVKTKEMFFVKGDLKVIFDKHYYCENCERNITVDDFYRMYVSKADGTPWFAPAKKEIY